MRRISFAGALAVAVMIVGFGSVDAGMLGIPMGPVSAIRHIKFETLTLPPMAYTMFCQRYAEECRAEPPFRSGTVSLTKERWANLKEVNQTINRSIVPDRNEQGLAGEAWLINPDRGDCNDYAVTKRHELLGRGWPSHALLLSEVVTNGVARLRSKPAMPASAGRW